MDRCSERGEREIERERTLRALLVLSHDVQELEALTARVGAQVVALAGRYGVVRAD